MNCPWDIPYLPGFLTELPTQLLEPTPLATPRMWHPASKILCWDFHWQESTEIHSDPPTSMKTAVVPRAQLSWSQSLPSPRGIPWDTIATFPQGLSSATFKLGHLLLCPVGD